MRESIVRALKWIILACALIMFFYQAKIAVNKLLNPPVVDSTEIISIAEVDPPLITICPKYQISSEISEALALGIPFKRDLLLGTGTKNNITGWGIHYNMTFDEWVEKIVDLDKDYPYLMFRMDNGQWLSPEYERRFYPKYGRCIDFSNYTITADLELNIIIDKFSTDHSPEAEVFLTDKKLRTRSTVHKPSHWGRSINIRQNTELEYLVKVQQLSSFDPRNPDDCKEYSDDEFERCVDEELQDLWKPIIGCNPPWLSPQDQCNALLNTSNMYDLVYNRTYKTLENILNMRNYAAKERCTKACLVTRQNIFKNEKRNVFGGGVVKLKLVFDDIVVRKTKMLTYNFSDFLVDIGSSLGLWFGLSVFGITDLGLMVIQWAERIRGGALKKYLD